MRRNFDFFFFKAEDGIRDYKVTGVQTCALPIYQPRMRAELPSSGDQVLTFMFLDATSLPSPSAGHMHRLVVSIEDDRHFTQRWTWTESGREEPQVFKFERKK